METTHCNNANCIYRFVGGEMMTYIITGFLLIFYFGLMSTRKQNETIIEQNEKLISLLEEIKINKRYQARNK